MAVALMAVVTATSLASPYLIKLVLDNAIAEHDLVLLRWLVGAYVAANAVGWVARAGQVGGVHRGRAGQHLPDPA